MVRLPWTTAGPAEGPAVVMASEFRRTTVRDAPAFLLDALRLRRRALAADGALGTALEARPLERTFRTLSAGRDRAALDACVRSEPRRRSMVRHRKAMAASRFTIWTTGDLPVTWTDAVERRTAQSPRSSRSDEAPPGHGRGPSSTRRSFGPPRPPTDEGTRSP